MKENLNSKSYWNDRFQNGSWLDAGRLQTMNYALANVAQLTIDESFTGTILDFGCALGDAATVYAETFPNAALVGVDHSEIAIKKCREKYGDISRFLCADYSDIPEADVIIASHVLEHIEGDNAILAELLGKCNDLFVIVPYKEAPLYIEHVNYYDEDYYAEFTPCEIRTFKVQYAVDKSLREWLRGALKFKLGLKREVDKAMILYHFHKEK
jgi:SAM-dependent methyltransferase